MLSQAIFTGSHITDGTLSRGEFLNGKKAHDGNDTIIYNEKNGKLFSTMTARAVIPKFSSPCSTNISTCTTPIS